jgi:hypothetical protein
MSLDAEFSRLIDATPEEVFDAFTDPEGQEAFYGQDDTGWIVESRKQASRAPSAIRLPRTTYASAGSTNADCCNRRRKRACRIVLRWLLPLVRSGHLERHAQTLALGARAMATCGPLSRARSAAGAASEPRRLCRVDVG